MAIGGLHPRTADSLRHPDFHRRAALLRELWPQAKSTREIAAEMGISKNAVCGMARRMGLPQRGNNPIVVLTPEQREARKKARHAALSQHARVRVRAHGPSPNAPRNVPSQLPAQEPEMVRTPNPDRNCCQWIINDGKPWLFCGLPAERGDWCGHHYRVCYRPIGTRQEAA